MRVLGHNGEINTLRGNVNWYVEDGVGLWCWMSFSCKLNLFALHFLFVLALQDEGTRRPFKVQGTRLIKE